MRQETSPGRAGDAALCALAVIAAAIVFAPITRCYFYADDFLNLYQIANFDFAKYLVTPNGGHLLVSRNLVFYLSRLLFGTEPDYYYTCAYALHLVNVALLFAVLRRLTERRDLACFGAALWGTCPTNEGALGWYAVFGQVMGTTTTLIILSRAAALAARDRWPSRAETALWYALALIGATGFGTGLALAAVLPLVLHWILPRRAAGARRLPPLATLPVVVPLLYVALMATFVAVSEHNAESQLPKAVLFQQVGAIAEVFGRLLSLGATRLLLGFWQGPAVDPPWYAAAALAVAAAATLAFSPPRERRLLAAALLLAAACYGSIAVARGAILLHLKEDLLPRIARYHYTGQLCFTIALCLALAAPLRRAGRAAGYALLALWLAASAFAYVKFAPPIDLHDAARAATRQALREMREAIEARPAGDDVLLPNAFFPPVPVPGNFFPGRAALFIIFFPANTVEGRRVYFVERRKLVLDNAGAGRRSATLIVPPPLASPLPPTTPRR